jgi:hypothetical protein
VQAKVKEAQANLVNIKADGEAGAGMVKVTVNGLKQIESIDIDQDIIKAEDKEMIQDLTIAAINKAIQEVEILSKEEMKKHTEGLIPNIPGLDLGGLF